MTEHFGAVPAQSLVLKFCYLISTFIYITCCGLFSVIGVPIDRIGYECKMEEILHKIAWYLQYFHIFIQHMRCIKTDFSTDFCVYKDKPDNVFPCATVSYYFKLQHRLLERITCLIQFNFNVNCVKMYSISNLLVLISKI